MGGRADANAALRKQYFESAVEQFRRTLALDSENVTAHHNLHLLYAQLGMTEEAQRHQDLHKRYRPDENARDRAVAAARIKYPWANHASQNVVIYDLQRDDAPGLSSTG